MKEQTKMFPWTIVLDGKLRMGVVLATDNFRAAAKVSYSLSDDTDIRKVRDQLKIGPPMEFNDRQFSEIDFGSMITANIAPALDYSNSESGEKTNEILNESESLWHKVKPVARIPAEDHLKTPLNIIEQLLGGKK